MKFFSSFFLHSLYIQSWRKYRFSCFSFFSLCSLLRRRRRRPSTSSYWIPCMLLLLVLLLFSAPILHFIFDAHDFPFVHVHMYTGYSRNSLDRITMDSDGHKYKCASKYTHRPRFSFFFSSFQSDNTRFSLCSHLEKRYQAFSH